MSEDKEYSKKRREAFKKREHIMRTALQSALGMLVSIPDETGKISEVGAMLADALTKEASVVIPDPRTPEQIQKQMEERELKKKSEEKLSQKEGGICDNKEKTFNEMVEVVKEYNENQTKGELK